MDGWKINFLLGFGLFSGAMLFLRRVTAQFGPFFVPLSSTCSQRIRFLMLFAILASLVNIRKLLNRSSLCYNNKWNSFQKRDAWHAPLTRQRGNAPQENSGPSTCLGMNREAPKLLHNFKTSWVNIKVMKHLYCSCPFKLLSDKFQANKNLAISGVYHWYSEAL